MKAWTNQEGSVVLESDQGAIVLDSEEQRELLVFLQDGQCNACGRDVNVTNRLCCECLEDEIHTHGGYCASSQHLSIKQETPQ